MNTAFVMSGGASLGAIEVGMLKALYERDIAPDLIVGSSVGALNGAFIASRPATVETAEELSDLWRSLKRGEVFPLNPVTGFMGFLGRRSYLIGNSNLRKLIERNLKFDRLEDAPIPMHVITTDLYGGSELRLSRGSAVDAVLASAAIPGVFPPVEREGKLLIDGGVVNNTPITHAVELGAEEVYVLPTGSACALSEPPHNAVAMVIHAITLMIQRRLIEDIKATQGKIRLVVLPPPCPLSVQPADFSHADELIDQSYEDSHAFLETAGPGDAIARIRMHSHS